MNKATVRALSVLVIAFAIRFIASVVTTATSLNPDSTIDAIAFGNHAANIAQGISEGHPYLYASGSLDSTQLLVPLLSADTHLMWGTFLAPFWLLPGPSGFYARLGNALLGALAIYNVYLIARHYYSHTAGVIATLPMLVYPSFVGVQSTLLREAIVLFGLTTAARLLIIPLKQRSRWFSYSLAIFLLHIALLQRPDNAIIVAAAISAAVVVYAVKSGYISKYTVGIGVTLSPIAFVLSLPIIRDGVEYLSYTRRVRAGGRAVYLQDVIPQTVLELVAFSWIGAAYFLYAPFPWMIETIPDLLVGIEGILNIVFTVAAIWGVRSFGQKNPYTTVGLVVGLTIAVVLYGVGTVNYGTGMRHRQMFLWIIFLFGGIGISEQVRVLWPFHRSRSLSTESSTNLD